MSGLVLVAVESGVENGNLTNKAQRGKGRSPMKKLLIVVALAVCTLWSVPSVQAAKGSKPARKSSGKVAKPARKAAKPTRAKTVRKPMRPTRVTTPGGKGSIDAKRYAAKYGTKL